MSTFNKSSRRFSKAKYDGLRKIGLKILDTSISLYQVPGFDELKKMQIGCLFMPEYRNYGNLIPLFDARINHQLTRIDGSLYFDLEVLTRPAEQLKKI